MFCRLFLVSALLPCCTATGESLTHAPPQEVEGLEKVLAFAGGDVILPCTFSNIASRDFPTVEWSKEDLKPNIIFLYRDGCEIQEMKNPAFEFRTSFVMKNLEHGGISLRISNVKLSDAGRYMCKRLWKNSISDVTTVELVVGAVSEPKLSMELLEGGGVTLLCEASCWLPEPDITFLDDQGNEIPAKEDPKRDLEASGCYTVRRRVPLPTATNMKMKRVICRVHQLQLNQSRDTAILVPAACTRSCPLTTCYTVGGVICFALVCAVGALLYCKFAEVQKLPVAQRASYENSANATTEDQLSLLQSALAESKRELDQRIKEVADLKLKPRERNETIHRLQGNISPQLSPILLQHNQRTIPCSSSSISPSDHKSTPAASINRNPPPSVNSSQKKDPKTGILRQHSYPGLIKNSSPDLSSSSVRTSETKTNPNPSKPQRRHSIGFSSAALYNNRYSPLAGLTEES
ncbi:butyrophilin subfamily 3 member A2-like isoform X1 [Scophthalmus maximus]|uniref:butyrophilin subfamily 3 member A2-like isoform X1 n=1 Tax=Scophthalmus maximus TaxID=52904 RepID=UPI0015E0B19F|nr:butyrophilin subfamily 3 member A2-like isoform X1 [Scophthalmus maximus]